MANDIFQYPQRTVEMPHDPELARRFYSVASNPEQNETQSYRHIKEIERLVESYRESATEKSIPKTRIEKIISFVMPNPEPLLVRLVEKESEIGGKLIEKLSTQDANSLFSRHRLWYHDANWYYENHDQHGPAVVRYQVTDTSMHKLKNGLEYGFDDGEQESLLILMQQYPEEIRRSLYFVDDVLAELNYEDLNKNDFDLAA